MKESRSPDSVELPAENGRLAYFVSQERPPRERLNQQRLTLSGISGRLSYVRNLLGSTSNSMVRKNLFI